MNLGNSKEVKDYFAKFTKFLNITIFNNASSPHDQISYQSGAVVTMT